MSLAIRTSIPFSAWAAEDDETVLTAFELLDEQDEENRRRGR